MSSKVVFIQGGGIGLVQERAVRSILAHTDLPCDDWLSYPAGAYAQEQGLEPLASELLEAIKQHKVAVKTKLLNSADQPYANYNVQLRQKLGLFAAVRPIRNLNGLPARFTNVDILLLREITEDLYSSIEHEIVPGVVESIKVVTEAACLRFFQFVFETARSLGRKTVHCIHKANILKLADGLMLNCFQHVAQQFPDLTAKDMIVDNCFMQLVARPHQFDVLATGNLYGDMISDLGSGLVGGISNAVGVNHGNGVRVFECIHGGPKTAIPPDQVNPLPMLFTVLEMFRATGHANEASRVQSAVEQTLVQGHQQDSAFGRKVTTDQLVHLITQALLAKTAGSRSSMG